jgi:phosphate uptake regulator
MKRKLTKQGNGGFVVTLPIDWVRDHNLKPSQEIDVDLTSEGVLIKAEGKPKERSIRIDISKNKERMIVIMMNQCYRLGYDLIKIEYDTPQQRDVIKKTTHDILLGFEVISDEKKCITIQNISEPDRAKFDIILRKIFLQLLEMSERITKELKGDKSVDPRENKIQLADLKIHIDRLTNYARRASIKEKFGGNKFAPLFLVISNLQIINHSYYYFYEYMANKGKTGGNVSEGTLDLVLKTDGLLRRFYDCFYNEDFKGFEDLDLEKLSSYDWSDIISGIKDTDELVVLAHLRETIRCVQVSVPSAIAYLLKE